MLCWFFVYVFSILFIFCNCVYILLDGSDINFVYDFENHNYYLLCCAGSQKKVKQLSVGGSARGGAMLWQSRAQWMVFHQVYLCSVSDLTFIYYLS